MKSRLPEEPERRPPPQPEAIGNLLSGQASCSAWIEEPATRQPPLSLPQRREGDVGDSVLCRRRHRVQIKGVKVFPFDACVVPLTGFNGVRLLIDLLNDTLCTNRKRYFIPTGNSGRIASAC